MRFIKNWFSNFEPSERPLVYQGIVYERPELFFQAMKAAKDELETRRWIAASEEPGIAKKRGRQIKCRPDWEQIKIDVMRYALRYKFAAGTKLAKRLLRTPDEELI